MLHPSLRHHHFNVLFSPCRRRVIARPPAIELLNARPETTRREATIIAQAGLPGSVRFKGCLGANGTAGLEQMSVRLVLEWP